MFFIGQVIRGTSVLFYPKYPPLTRIFHWPGLYIYPKYLNKNFSTVQMSLRGGFLLFPTKQSPVFRDVSIQKEIASPPKTRAAARNDINLFNVR
jgi:hypothetical protein